MDTDSEDESESAVLDEEETSNSTWTSASSKWGKFGSAVKNATAVSNHSVFEEMYEKWQMFAKEPELPSPANESPVEDESLALVPVSNDPTMEEIVSKFDLPESETSLVPIDPGVKQRADDIAAADLSLMLSRIPSLPAHSQVDHLYYLVPDLKEITKCTFYWGKLDCSKAEDLLRGEPEGTFLLRDSSKKEGFLLSTSFRRYRCTLHEPIDLWNHRFSFDARDPYMYSSPTVTGLVIHYRVPSRCMFFEPMLTTPFYRKSPLELRVLARAALSGQFQS